MNDDFNSSKFLDLSEYIENGKLTALLACVKHIRKVTYFDLKESRDFVFNNKNNIGKNGGVDLDNIQGNEIDYESLLKDLNQHIISYQSLVISSFKMINSLNEDDMIAFYEMYEVFDKLGIFDNQWQKSMLEKLGDLTSSLDDVSKSLKNVNSTIKNGMDNLSKDLFDVSKVMSKGLDTISSEIQYQSEELSSGLDTISSDIQNQND